MVSLEEDELVQMVQDFIESESTSPATSTTSSNFHALTHRTQYLILQDILKGECDTKAEAKVLKNVLKHMKRGKEGISEKTRTSRSWIVKRMKMDGLNASLRKTSWATSSGCPAGEYEYIEVIIEEENYGVRVIADIDFRSQFELARPTEYYRELTESVPVIFVGTENKLRRIISLLCSAAKQSLREKGLHVPPWRTTAYMESKWLSGGNAIASDDDEEIRKNYYNKGGKDDDVHGTVGFDGTIGTWVPPIVKPKKRDHIRGRGGSGLSTQFSNMTVNCCYV